MRIILLALLASLNVTGCGGGSSSSSGNGDTELVNAESNGESSGEVCSDVETLSSGNYDSVIAKWKTLDQIKHRGPARMVAVGSSSIRYWRSLFPNFSECFCVGCLSLMAQTVSVWWMVAAGGRCLVVGAWWLVADGGC